MGKRGAALLAAAGAATALVALGSAPANAENHWGCYSGQFCVVNGSGYHYGWSYSDGSYANNHYRSGAGVDNSAHGVHNNGINSGATNVYFYQLASYGGTRSWCVKLGQSYDFNDPAGHHQWWINRPSSHQWVSHC